MDDWKRIQRLHLLSLFPQLSPAVLLEEEIKLGKLLHAAATLAISAYELNVTAARFLEDVEEIVRQIGAGLESLISPMIKVHSKAVTAFEKERRRNLLAIVTGRHKSSNSTSSSSDSSDDDDAAPTNKAARTDDQSTKRTRHQRRKAAKGRRGLAAFDKNKADATPATSDQPDATPLPQTVDTSPTTAESTTNPPNETTGAVKRSRARAPAKAPSNKRIQKVGVKSQRAGGRKPLATKKAAGPTAKKKAVKKG